MFVNVLKNFFHCKVIEPASVEYAILVAKNIVGCKGELR